MRTRRLYLLSPAGALSEPEALARAVTRLEALGLAVEVDRAAGARWQRFAGRDASRIAAIDRAIASGTEWVMATRGGFGCTRLLPRIDYERMARTGQQWVGHSDWTAVAMASYRMAGMTSWIGPMATFDFGAPEEPDAFMTESFLAALGGHFALAFDGRRIGRGVLRDGCGLLWGGNLSLLAALLGTPYFPAIAGGILFLEETGEAPYRIERMLWQLLQAGVLARQQAILIGDIDGYRLSPHDAGYDLDAALRWIARQCPAPLVTGLPYGHGRRKATLPFGRPVHLRRRRGMLRLSLA